MNVAKITNNNLSYKGIKLSSGGLNNAHRVINFLQINGFECIEQGNSFLGGKLKDKMQQICKIRNLQYFNKDEFSVVYSPCTDEVYLLSTPAIEQKLIKWVKEIDEDASVNLLI